MSWSSGGLLRLLTSHSFIRLADTTLDRWESFHAGLAAFDFMSVRLQKSNRRRGRAFSTSGEDRKLYSDGAYAHAVDSDHTVPFSTY